MHTISPKQGAPPNRGRGVFIRTHEARIGGDNQRLEHRIVILGQPPFLNVVNGLITTRTKDCNFILPPKVNDCVSPKLTGAIGLNVHP